MTDPTRWADTDDVATPIEQSLVRAGQDVRMPTQDKDVLWVRILGAISPVPANPAPPMPANAAGSGAAATVTAPTTLKILSVILAMIGSGAVAHQVGWWAAFESERRIAVASAAFVESPPDISAAGVLDAGTASEEKAEPRSGAVLNDMRQSEPRTAPPTASTSSAASAVSLLREESQVVLAARRALRAGDASTGLRILEKAQQRFGTGVLSEERAALWIEALARSGDRVRASKRARTFLSSHPKSPHTADVQRYVLP